MSYLFMNASIEMALDVSTLSFSMFSFSYLRYFHICTLKFCQR